jgi:hypothetical protein
LIKKPASAFAAEAVDFKEGSKTIILRAGI